MNQLVSDHLLELVESEKARLLHYSESATSLRSASAKWTAKEILGHLIDSAVNNHQRFVRAQQPGSLVFPGYDQDHWVKANRYNSRIWMEIVLTWASFNRYLTGIVRAIPDAAIDTQCLIGEEEPVSLEFLIEDYIRHMLHHLQQIHELCGDDQQPAACSRGK